jgi:hypothetical protein
MGMVNVANKYAYQSFPFTEDILPIKPETNQLFTAVNNGILLWYVYSVPLTWSRTNTWRGSLRERWKEFL